MIPENRSRLSFPRAARFSRSAFAALIVSGAALLAMPSRAEDPLLGQIKVIKCVGCDPGAVNLIVHDPIDVRDFEIQIKESDYQKIVTSLAGKTIYDKEGCFYWMEMPKGYKPAAAKDTAKVKDAKKTTAKKDEAASTDSSQPGAVAAMETSAPQGTPSRCLPYVRVETKPTHPGGKKDEE